jgi:hypothetical protein
MPDLEFLPQWYPQARRQARRVRIELATAALLVLALGTWLVFAWQGHADGRDRLSQLDAALAQADSELQLLDEQTRLLRELQKQQEIESSVGLSVEMTRLIGAVHASMPESMSLLTLEVATEQSSREVSKVAATVRKGSKPAAVAPDRHLAVRIVAVAPTDAEITSFFAQLTEVPSFHHVRMSYARDLVRNNRQMREVEIQLRLPLATPAGGGA